MSNDDRSASRAEARRRARLAARGEHSEPETTVDPEPEPPSERGGFLRRMFPPAPPLPNRPDPLAGFSGSGPLRPIAERLYLLRQNPLAWIVPGIVAVPGIITSVGSTGTIGLVGTFLLFGALIAAGWFGWQRPTLFGVAAAILGAILAIAASFVSFALRGAGPEMFLGSTEILTGTAFQIVYNGALGFLGGWYGGYLRRRQTQLSTQQPRRRSRR